MMMRGYLHFSGTGNGGTNLVVFAGEMEVDPNYEVEIDEDYTLEVESEFELMVEDDVEVDTCGN